MLPPEARRAQGNAAEDRACRHLEGSGMTIVERNFRARGGEIDIVARKGDVLVFVEVRSREVPDFGAPEESVTPAKRRRIVGAARQYLSKVPPSSWREARGASGRTRWRSRSGLTPTATRPSVRSRPPSTGCGSSSAWARP